MALDNEFREVLESITNIFNVIIPEYVEDARQRIALCKATLDNTDSSEAEPSTVAAYREDLDEFDAKVNAVFALVGSSQHVDEAAGFDAEDEEFEAVTVEAEVAPETVHTY